MEGRWAMQLMQEMEDMPTDQITFPEPTQEMSIFDVAVEATLAAVMLEMAQSGASEAGAARLVESARMRVYGGGK